jgi:hypothetical protein
MPEYHICYLDECGMLTHTFCATCLDDRRAQIIAHAMKTPDCKHLEVWQGEVLVYRRAPEVGLI